VNGAVGAVRLTPSLTPSLALSHARTATGLAYAASPVLLLSLFGLAVAAGGVPVAVAWLTRAVLDGLIGGRSSADLGWLAGALGLVGIAAVIVPRISQYAEAQLGRRIRVVAIDRLYTAMNERLLGLSKLEDPRFHDRMRLAQQAGSTGPSDLVTNAIGIGRNVITLSGFLVTLLLMNPWLVLAVAVAAVPTMRAELLLSRRRAQAMWRIGHAERRQFFYANLLSSVREAKEIRLFGLGAFFRGRMLTELRQANADNQALDRRELRVQAVLGVLGAVVVTGGLIWAVLAARSGALTPGDVTVFIAAIAGTQAALSGAIGQFAASYQALLLLDHYHEATNVERDLPVPQPPTPVPGLTGSIELRDVWFRYGPGLPWVLRGVSLSIEAGKSLALVGLNGAGKSTVVKLLCRLYDPVRGQILWNGVDLSQLDPAELRERIGTVFQDYVEYELSASDNIGVGDVPRLGDRASIEDAAKRAGIHEALTRLPKGYETLLTRMFLPGSDEGDPDSGVLLSGGQGQRLALARAMLRDQRDLLILDEPSSGLDAVAEREIHVRLRQHRAGRTTVLISHRLNTIRDADRIAVLDGGQITELGTHRELVEAGGTYAELFTLQAQGYAEEVPA
jgi:ATP-binding cassette subfamily B protein